MGFGHFDRYGDKVVHELIAAEGPAADAQATQHFRLVPHTDLPQLNAGVEGGSQILHQLPEIHPTIGGKEKQDLVAIKGAFHPHQLHLQPVLGDFLLANGEGILLPFPGQLQAASVVFRGQAQHSAQGLHHLVVLHRVVALRTRHIFCTLGRFHDHVLACLNVQLSGTKVIGFASAAKADADDFCHRVSSHSAAMAPKTWPTATFHSHSWANLPSISHSSMSCFSPNRRLRGPAAAA